MRLFDFIKTELQRFRNTVNYRSEEFFTSRRFSLLFLCPRTTVSKQEIIGKIMDFFLFIEIRRSNLFKAVFRAFQKMIF